MEQHLFVITELSLSSIISANNANRTWPWPGAARDYRAALKANILGSTLVKATLFSGCHF